MASKASGVKYDIPGELETAFQYRLLDLKAEAEKVEKAWAKSNPFPQELGIEIFKSGSIKEKCIYARWAAAESRNKGIYTQAKEMEGHADQWHAELDKKTTFEEDMKNEAKQKAKAENAYLLVDPKGLKSSSQEDTRGLAEQFLDIPARQWFNHTTTKAWDYCTIL